MYEVVVMDFLENSAIKRDCIALNSEMYQVKDEVSHLGILATSNL